MKIGKHFRMLALYDRLRAGKIINCAEATIEYGVDERSIQRDISDINAYLLDRMVSDGIPVMCIIYDREKLGYRLM